MTRDEAITKLMRVPLTLASRHEPDVVWLVDALVALDILKVEEPKDMGTEAALFVLSGLVLGYPGTPHVWKLDQGGANKVIEALDTAGLTIVRKEDAK